MRNAKEIAKHVHRTRALNVLGNDPIGRWLANQPYLLDELGRIASDHALLTIARRLDGLRPETDEAIEMIRRHREFDQLADEIVHVVEDYCQRHPTTQRQDILRAIGSASLMLGEHYEAADSGRHQFLCQ